MGMAIDEAGDGYHAGAIDDGFRGLLGSAFGDGDDFSAVNADIDTEQYFHPGVHGDSGYV